MPRRLDTHRLDALNALIATQEGLITAAQAAALGIERASLDHRVRATEIWQRLLPGTYLTHRGRPTASQRRRAALLYAGSDAVLTGSSALAVHGSRVATRRTGDNVLVLVPHHRQRSTTGFVVIERTTRMPAVLVRGDLPLARPARAAVDAARRMTELDQVRALLSDVVQSGLSTPGQLAGELALAQRRGTRLARRAVEALLDGTRSEPEALLRDLWHASGLPEPLWNPTLTTPEGLFIARPDAYLPDLGIAVEVESQEFHFAPADWARTMERHANMTSFGLVVVHAPPSRLVRDGAGFMQALGRTIRVNEGRERPLIIVQRAA